MMNDKLTLDKYDINNYTFNITTEGVDSSELEVYFYIDLPDMRIQFKCNADKNNYSCATPILEFINKASYQCGLIVYSEDGYYFEPFSGNINVVAKPKVVADVKPRNAKLTATFSGSNTTPKPVKEEVQESIIPIIKKEEKIELHEDKSLLNFINREKQNKAKTSNQNEGSAIPQIFKMINNTPKLTEMKEPEIEIKEDILDKKGQSISAILEELGIANKSKS